MTLSGCAFSGCNDSQSPNEVQSLPQVVDDLGHYYPDNVWMTVPLGSDLSGRWRNVTYKELACAVDGMLAWMGEALGDYRSMSRVAAYIG